MTREWKFFLIFFFFMLSLDLTTFAPGHPDERGGGPNYSGPDLKITKNGKPWLAGWLSVGPE